MDTFVLKIGTRFFYEYKNKRINTAYYLSGAKLFNDGLSELDYVEKILNKRKIKYKKVFVEIVDEKDIDPSEISSKEFDYVYDKPFELPNDHLKREKLLMRFKLPLIFDYDMIDRIVTVGYAKTGNKFAVSFNGSKGYPSHIEISSEGFQKEENRIFFSDSRNKNGNLKNVMVNVFYSTENGIRLSCGKDLPKIIMKPIDIRENN